MSRFWRVWFLVLVALLFSAWIVAGSNSFQSCMQEEQHNSAKENALKGATQFFAAVSAQKDCTGHFVEENGQGIIASFTIILTISIISLWLATNRLWAAGEKQFALLSETAAAQSRDMQASITASTKALEIATQAYLAEHGTWLRVYSTIVGPIRFAGGKISMEISIETENIGKNPAIGVRLGCRMFRTLGYSIGGPETSACIEQTKGFATLGELGRDLLPGEKMSLKFAADAEAAPRLEGLVLDQVMAGIPESNFAPVLNAAFCAIWKTPASDTWRHSASAVVLTVKGKGTKMDMRDGEISSDELGSVLIPGDQLAG
jgi:hypothetical protein